MPTLRPAYQPPTFDELEPTDEERRAAREAASVGGTNEAWGTGIGSALGAILGGAAGTFVAPGLGTAAGAGLGAAAGGGLGKAIGSSLANQTIDRDQRILDDADRRRQRKLAQYQMHEEALNRLLSMS